MSVATVQEQVGELLAAARAERDLRRSEFDAARLEGSAAGATAASTAYSLASGLVRALEEAEETAGRLIDPKIEGAE